MANDLTQIVTEKMQGLPIEEQQNVCLVWKCLC